MKFLPRYDIPIALFVLFTLYVRLRPPILAQLSPAWRAALTAAGIGLLMCWLLAHLREIYWPDDEEMPF